MEDLAEQLLASAEAQARLQWVERMRIGKQRAAQRRLLAGESRPCDLERAGQDPTFLLQLHRSELNDDIALVADRLLRNSWRGSYEELLVVAAAIAQAASAAR